MDTRRIEWEEDKEYTEDQVKAVALKKYNYLLKSSGNSNKYPKDVHILALLWLSQNLEE